MVCHGTCIVLLDWVLPVLQVTGLQRCPARSELGDVVEVGEELLRFPSLPVAMSSTDVEALRQGPGDLTTQRHPSLDDNTAWRPPKAQSSKPPKVDPKSCQTLSPTNPKPPEVLPSSTCAPLRTAATRATRPSKPRPGLHFLQC